MATAACLPIAADRAGPCVRTIFFEGLDLTGVTLALEARLNPETPGPAPIALGMGATANAEGLRLVDVTVADGVPTSQVVLRINETTMKDASKVPYAGELGSTSVLYFDLIGTFGQDKRRLAYGTLSAVPTVYGMDAAPTNRPAGGSGAASTGGAWLNARAIFSNDDVRVVIDGADLLGGYASRSEIAASRAVAAAETAVAVNDAWQVSFSKAIIVDHIANVVRYPKFLLMRESEGLFVVNPESYNLPSFDLPIPAPGENNNIFHYVDVAQLRAQGTSGGSPLKFRENADVDPRSANLAILGNAYEGSYTSATGAEIVSPVASNMFLDGRTMDGPFVRGFGGGIQDNLRPIVSPELLAKGFTKGYVVDSVGQDLPAPITRNTKAVFTFYAETDAENVLPANGTLFLWSISDYQTAVNFPRVQQLSSRAAKYSVQVDIPASMNLHHFFMALDMSASGVEARITGSQFHCSDTPAYTIADDDYPANDGALARRDDAAVQRSLAMRVPRPSRLQRPTFKYSLLIGTGQSIMAGQETYPRLSRITYPGTMMLGTGPLPKTGAANGVGRQYITVDGDYSLTSLTASTTLTFTRESTLSDAEVADPNIVFPGFAAYAEPPTIGWARGMRWYLDQHLLTTGDPRQYLVINEAVSGEPLASWQKPNGRYYGRALDAVAKVKAAAGSDTVGVIATAYYGSQFDYYALGGGVNNKANQKSGLVKFFNDQQTDFAALTGQTQPFAKFLIQAGGAYTQDVQDDGQKTLPIGMAQLEIALERPDVFMAGPVYQFTDKLREGDSEHDDANGARAAGWLLAKVSHLVVHRSEEWEPTRPLIFTRDGDRLFGDFHVPVPPLVRDQPYRANTAVDVAQSGFKVTDDSGDVPLGPLAIVGQAQIRLDLMRSTVGVVRVWYAHQSVGGLGMLRDSDPTTSLDVYEYLPESGMYASANIPALVGQPYRLQNWCTAFVLPVGVRL
ncbi:hypothetical protein ACQHGV_13385 [Sphingomonas pseudosanguinis]|uniref:hypothetical protein n=1 Tax=Sphingomonas pseudosanguinis TaxID=413712 RepID=UPI003F832D29